MKRILDTKDLEVGKFYFHRSASFPEFFNWQIDMVHDNRHGLKALGISMCYWCYEEYTGPNILDKFEIYGPIETPDVKALNA